jgi:hypothetical protein
MLRISLEKIDNCNIYIPGKTIHLKQESEIYSETGSLISEKIKSFTPDTTGCFTINTGNSKDIICVNYPDEESESQILDKNFSASNIVRNNKNIPQYTEKNIYAQNSENNTNNSIIWFYLLTAAAVCLFTELLISNRTAL